MRAVASNDLKLTAVEPRPTLSVLIQGSAAPAFRGTDPNGARYLCGVCSTRVLAEHVAEGDLYDIAFLCGACGGLSMGPQLPAGRPLPWPKTVVVPPGNYLIASTVDWKDDLVMAGQEAVVRALSEIGSPIGIDLGPETQLDAELLDSLVARTKALLGDDAYAELAATYERGRRSPTPPKFPHRLMELTTAAEAASASFREGRPEVDPVATVELHGMVRQLDRWRNHPSWGGLLPSLKSPQDFPHVLITIATASFLSDAGNGVEIVPAGETRLPDLRLHLGARTAVSTEVKVPSALQRPSAALDQTSADAIVQKTFGKAGSGPHGQLAPGADAVFVLGGYGLRRIDLTTLEAAARNLFRHYPEKRTHVLGIAIVSLGTLLDSRPSSVGRTLPILAGTLDARIVTNENYSGPNRISQEQRPGLKPVTGLQEIELRRGAATEMRRPNRAERRRAARRPHRKR